MGWGENSGYLDLGQSSAEEFLTIRKIIKGIIKVL